MGNTPKYLKQLCEQKKFTYMGCAEIVMPENYIAIPEKKVSAFAKAGSGVINTLFYPLIVSAKKFYVTDACIGCGKCTEVCPLNNVSLKDGKPVWGDQCTHCMACICKCPKEAIEYGNRSKGKPRYQCPL